MKSVLALLLVALLLTPSVVYAEGEDVVTTITPTVSTTTSLKDIRQKQRQELKTLRETQKTALAQQRNATDMKVAAFRDELKLKRQEFSASQSALRAQFKANLRLIKDARKKTIVEGIDTKLTQINQKRTDRMADALDKMTGFLNRLQARVDTLTQEGKDTTSAQTALTSAATAIDTAKAAVASQAAKAYTAPITTDETTLGTTVGGTFQQLKTDLQSVYELIHTAKQTLMKAVREVARLGGIKSNTFTGSTSGTPVPSVSTTASPSPSLTTTPVVTEPVSSESAQ